jgi:hypothetical protein
VHEGAEDLHEELEHIDLVVVGLGDLHAFLNKPLFDNVLIEGERPDMVGRGIIGKYSCCSK